MIFCRNISFHSIFFVYNMSFKVQVYISSQALVEIWSQFKQVEFQPVCIRKASQGNCPKNLDLKDAFTRSLGKACSNLVVMFL